jgi:hypothetical protein
MDTETEANLAPEVVDIPSPESITQDAEANAADTGNDAGEQDELDKLIGTPEGEPEEVEVEYEGKAYKLPPELKDALLRQSDYTKKTMTVAEERRAIETRAKQLESFETLSNERRQAFLNSAVLRQQIKQIDNISTDGLTQEEINGLLINKENLNAQVAQWDNYERQVAQREQDERGQQFAKAREDALAQAAHRVPNFTNERRAALESLAVELGASQADVQNISDPTVYEVLHYADIGRKFIERQRKAATIKAAGQAPTAVTVGGKGTGSKAPEQMSPAEMAKHLGY